MKLKEVAIERSTNTHMLSGVKNIKEMTDCTVVEVDESQSILSHGVHGSLKVESTHAVVYRQQELNPVTQGYQAVVD